ncbi:DUF3039 domain-containing protein [Corynebacterium flavescens]|uniref:DUF3039 domain-containing protein n=2 Tax=Corynebacterium flavescens TaxID=28028 RepID=UPI003FD47ABF
MHQLPRLTIRCATDDLHLGHWNSEGPISGFPDTGDHEVVSKAATIFPETRDKVRAPAKISSVKPACYKIKIKRSRGAAYIDDSGQVWVVAAGIREEGSQKDFYDQFTQLPSSSWLPTDKDRDLLKKQDLRSSLSAWGLRVWNGLNELVPNSTRKTECTLSVQHPFTDDSAPVCTLKVGVVVVDGEPLGVEVRVEDFINVQNAPIIRLAHLIAMSWIHRDEQFWSITPAVASITFDEAHCAEEVFAGKFRASSPMLFSPGGVAHRVKHTSAIDICDATIEGSPVQALCGQTFVPRQDHQKLNTCEECENVLSVLDSFLESSSEDKANPRQKH